MSRSTTTSGTAPQTGKPMPTAASTQASQGQACVPTDKVAMLAYQKWVKSGCKHGLDKQHWLEAEAELKAEMTRTSTAQARK